MLRLSHCGFLYVLSHTFLTCNEASIDLLICYLELLNLVKMFYLLLFIYLFYLILLGKIMY